MKSNRTELAGLVKCMGDQIAREIYVRRCERKGMLVRVRHK